jgi:arginine transport system substrate-binding protein
MQILKAAIYGAAFGLLTLGIGACTRGCSEKKEAAALVVGTNSGYPPYESVNAAGELQGFDIDVAKEIGKLQKRDVIFKDMAFDALILGLKQKKFDFVIAGISITADRKKEIALIPYQGRPVRSYTLLFYHDIPEGVSDTADIARLPQKSVAVLIGTTMEDYLKDVPGIVAKPLESISEMLLDVEHKKSAALIVEDYIAEDVLSKRPGLKALQVRLEQKHWVDGNGIGVRKDNEVMLAQLADAVSTLKNNGTLALLEKKWFGVRGN